MRVLLLASLTVAFSNAAFAAQHTFTGEMSTLDSGTMATTGTWEFSGGAYGDRAHPEMCLGLQTEVERSVDGPLPGIPATEIRGTGTDMCQRLPTGHTLAGGIDMRRCDGGSTFASGIAGAGISSARVRLDGAPSVPATFYEIPGLPRRIHAFLITFPATHASRRVYGYDHHGHKIARLPVHIPACAAGSTSP